MTRAGVALVALLALGLCACGTPLYTVEPDLPTPRAHDEWSTLVEDIRSYQQRIGFTPTPNFRRADDAAEAYTFCGHGSPLYLPYSYQDPAIRWLDVRTEEECRTSAENTEVAFVATEAVAGRGTPITGKLLVAPLARFLYVVMHEDCHEQFGFPAGIEEALCNALAYAGMEDIARERFGDAPIEYRAISAFVSSGAARAEFTLQLYENLAALYAQHESGLISSETLLADRGEIFREAGPQLARYDGALNNVWLATAVTYSRHYRLMRRVLDAFEGDLAQTVAFFKRLDAAKPERSSFAAKHGCGTERDVAFVRAYEAAIVAVIEETLATGRMLDDALAQRPISEGVPCGHAAAEGRVDEARQR